MSEQLILSVSKNVRAYLEKNKSFGIQWRDNLYYRFEKKYWLWVTVLPKVVEGF